LKVFRRRQSAVCRRLHADGMSFLGVPRAAGVSGRSRPCGPGPAALAAARR